MVDRFFFIRKVIQAELDLGHVVDVDKHCRVLKRAFTDLDAEIIPKVILGVVAKNGGAAEWGTEEAFAEKTLVQTGE